MLDRGGSSSRVKELDAEIALQETRIEQTKHRLLVGPKLDTAALQDIHPDALATIRKTFAAALEAGDSQPSDHRYQSRD